MTPAKLRRLILPAFALVGGIDGLRLLTGADYANASRFMLATDALRGILLGIGAGSALVVGLSALARRLLAEGLLPSNVVRLADHRKAHEPPPDDMA